MGKRHEQRIYDELATKYLVEGLSLIELSKQSGIDRRTLSTNFKRMGIEIVNKQNLTKFDEHIFDEIDSEEKAYWLGFIYADGNISTNGFRFTLKLAIKDLKHLEKFNKFMNHTKYNITILNYEYDHESCSFVVYSKHLHNTLNNYGCTPNKSLTLEFPNKSIFKSDNLIRHFIRGYFDGDGCIWRDNTNNKLNFNILGTENMLMEIQKYFPIKKLNNIHNKQKDQEFTKSLNYKGKIANTVICYLFDECNIFLDRKYELYKELKNKYEI